MSLNLLDTSLRGMGFPRVSGDEPSPEAHRRTDSSFSPRERG